MKHLVRSLHQIEMTSRCNLKCKYCTHRKLGRAKEDMDHETFLHCLEVAKHFVAAGTQGELNLAGIGESTIHPRFIEYVRLAREAIGWSCRLVLSTNGVALTEDMVRQIAHTKILVWVSPHQPVLAAPAINALKKYGLYQGESDGAWTASVDWAGQVDWPVTAATKGTPCPWLPLGRVTVFSDGRISRCCFDSDGRGVIGTINELVAGKPLYTEAYSLCDACHHSVVDVLPGRLGNEGFAGHRSAV